MIRHLRIAAGLVALSAWLAAMPAPASAEIRTMVFKSKGTSVPQYQAKNGSERAPTPAIDGSIIRFEARVVDENGVEIPQSEVMLHHLVFFNGGYPGARRQDGSCPQRPVGQRFFGTSEELRALTLPQGYGYPINAQDNWRMGWMLMNHTNEDRKAWIQYTVTVDTDPALKPVTPYWVSVIPCREDPQYSVPGDGAPGSTHRRKAPWTVPRNGRIVAVGGHAHGGARAVTLGSRTCNTDIFSSRPTYGMPDNPVYQVKPQLHEPDPLNMTWWQSATGRSVTQGETLVVKSDYDNSQPHMRVMGIAHVYIAEGEPAGPLCEPGPADAEVLGPDWQGRSDPPPNELTLARVFEDGFARPIAAPPGRLRTFPGSTTAKVNGLGFIPANLSVPAGSTVSWRFTDPMRRHDATLATGPRGFGVPWSKAGVTQKQRFSVPGTYRIYCSLHPAQMSQVVKVRGRRR